MSDRPEFEATHGDAQPLLKPSSPSPLPIEEAPPGNTTLVGAIYLIMNTVMGAGLLTLPFGVMNSGLVMGLLLMLGVAIISAYSLRVIQRCCDITQAYTFKELALRAFGDKASIGVQMMTIVLAFAVCIADMILFADFLSLVFSEVLPGTVFTTRGGCIMFISVLLLVACQIKDMSKISQFSAFAIACVIYVILTVFIYLCVQGPTSGDISWLIDTHIDGPMLAIPLSMKARRVDGARVAYYSMAFVFVFNAIMGVSGYMTFGDKTDGDITLNFSSSYLMMLIGRLGMCVSVFFIYVMLVVLVREAVEAEVNINRRKRAEQGGFVEFKFTFKQFLMFSTVWVMVTALIGWFTPGVQVVLGLLGSTLGAMSAYIIPGALGLKLLTKFDKTGAWTLMTVGFVTMAFGLFANINRLL